MGDRIAVMANGVLQQLDAPEALHDRPSNLFVAGFIGSPSMNFFPATVTGTPEAPIADAGVFRAPLAATQSRALGRSVILGVRPEDIEDAAHTQGTGTVPVDANVEVVEYLGNERQLHLTAGGTSFVGRVTTDTVTRPGAALRVGFDLRKLHVFDTATELAIR